MLDCQNPLFEANSAFYAAFLDKARYALLAFLRKEWC